MKSYPLQIVIDKTAQDIRDTVRKLGGERGIGADIMELILYKVLSEIQLDMVYAYTNTVIDGINAQAKEENPGEGNDA